MCTYVYMHDCISGFENNCRDCRKILSTAIGQNLTSEFKGTSEVFISWDAAKVPRLAMATYHQIDLGDFTCLRKSGMEEERKGCTSMTLIKFNMIIPAIPA